MLKRVDDLGCLELRKVEGQTQRPRVSQKKVQGKLWTVSIVPRHQGRLGFKAYSPPLADRI